MIDSTHHSAVIVDPGDAEPVSYFLQQQHLTLAAILVTHHHWDHTNGVMSLKTQYNVPIYAPKNTKMAGTTHPVAEGDIVEIENFHISFTVMEIPGHTLDHIAYCSSDRVFCGDTLFAAGCGRVFEGTAAQMYASLQKIAGLPNTTHIYCAHEYTLKNLRFAKLVEPNNQKIIQRIQLVSELRNQNQPSLPSLLADEKDTNPFLRCDSPELIANVEQYAGKPLKNAVEVFSYLRRWKDNFT